MNIWKDDVASVVTHTLGPFINFEKDDTPLYEAALTDDSNEVATTIAGYIAKKVIKRWSCIICKSCLVSEKGIHFEKGILTTCRLVVWLFLHLLWLSLLVMDLQY